MVMAIKKKTMPTMLVPLPPGKRGWGDSVATQGLQCMQHAGELVRQPHVMQANLLQAGPQHTCRHPTQLQQGTPSPLPTPPCPNIHAHCSAGGTYCSRGIDVLRELCLKLAQHVHQRCRLASSCSFPTVCTCRVSRSGRLMMAGTCKCFSFRGERGDIVAAHMRKLVR